MKKTSTILALAVITSASFLFSSCTGNKAETADAVEEAEDITDAQVATAPVPVVEIKHQPLTDAQKKAFIDASLLTEGDFAKAVFVDFNATWCGPCRQFTPYFENAAETFAGQASFIPVDFDKYRTVAEAFGIESIPTVIAITPSGEYDVYIGTTDLVGDGKFDEIVKNHLQ